MSHPRDGAFLRLERADRHITEDQSYVTAYARACEEGVVVELDEQTGNSIPVALNDPPSLPVELPLAVSDALHNLRAALDYAVYELAKKDAGEVVERTQFIIADDEEGFASLKWCGQLLGDRDELAAGLQRCDDPGVSRP